MARVTFVYPGFESLGIEYLSSYLRSHGHETRLVFDPQLFQDDYSRAGKAIATADNARLRSILIDEVLASDPDIVGFSVVTDQYLWALQFAAQLKEKRPGLPIIFGGIHPTSVPELVIRQPQVDIVCVGDGEDAFLELVNSFEEYRRKKQLIIPNLWFKADGEVYSNPVRDLRADLDSLPFPDKAMFYEQLPAFRLQYNLLTGRGCAFHCSYCCNNFLKKLYHEKGKYLRQRSVKNVIDELVLAKEKYDIPFVFIRDEVFGYNLEWLKNFADEYSRKIKIPFKCFIEPSLCREEIVRELKRAGCIYVSMGIQSTNEYSRKTILFRPESNQQIARSMAMFHKAGIKVNIDHIAGIPGEGEKEMVEAAWFYNRIRPNVVTYFWLTLYPNTEMVDIFKQKGLASDEEITRVMEGRGASDFQGGNVTMNRETFFQFRTLLCYLPLLPSFIITLILKLKLYRFMAWRSIFLSSLLPRLLLAPFNADLQAWRAEIGYNLGKMKIVKRKLKEGKTRTPVV